MSSLEVTLATIPFSSLQAFSLPHTQSQDQINAGYSEIFPTSTVEKGLWFRIDSIVSASSEELENFGEEVVQDPLDQIDNFAEELHSLFQIEDTKQSKEEGQSFRFKPLPQSEIPVHIKSIIAECGLVMG